MQSQSSYQCACLCPYARSEQERQKYSEHLALLEFVHASESLLFLQHSGQATSFGQLMRWDHRDVAHGGFGKVPARARTQTRHGLTDACLV
mgnify:FL=1